MMDAKIKELDALLAPHYQEIAKLQKAIWALQDLCDHNMESTGHGHNYTCYKCTKCGATEDR